MAIELPEGWIAHDGGPCPITEQRAIEVIIRARIRGVVLPQAIGWERGSTPRPYDIIAYKPEGQHHGD